MITIALYTPNIYVIDNEKVLATLKEIRAKHKHYVAAHEIKGNYYLYENLSKWDPERRKQTISFTASSS